MASQSSLPEIVKKAEKVYVEDVEARDSYKKQEGVLFEEIHSAWKKLDTLQLEHLKTQEQILIIRSKQHSSDTRRQTVLSNSLAIGWQTIIRAVLEEALRTVLSDAKKETNEQWLSFKDKRSILLSSPNKLSEMSKTCGITVADVEVIYNKDYVNDLNKDVHRYNLSSYLSVQIAAEAIAKEPKIEVRTPLMALLKKFSAGSPYWEERAGFDTEKALDEKEVAVKYDQCEALKKEIKSTREEILALQEKRDAAVKAIEKEQNRIIASKERQINSKKKEFEAAKKEADEKVDAVKASRERVREEADQKAQEKVAQALALAEKETQKVMTEAEKRLEKVQEDLDNANKKAEEEEKLRLEAEAKLSSRAFKFAATTAGYNLSGQPEEPKEGR